MSVTVTLITPTTQHIFSCSKDFETPEEAFSGIKEFQSMMDDQTKKSSVFLFGDLNVEAFAKLLIENLTMTGGVLTQH